MKISIIQMNSEIGKVEKNYKKAFKLLNLAKEKKPDVIVLSEFFNTGFFPRENLHYFCDKNGEILQENIGKFAFDNKINIVAGSIINLKNNGIYNSCYVFDTSGKIIANYDKMHLFSLANENLYFSSGKKLCGFFLNKERAGIAICYDLRFGEIFRIYAKQGIKIIFLLAQWPKSRLNDWVTLIKARAIENQFFVCAVNGCGVNENGEKIAGNSLLISPNGNEILHFDNKEGVKTAEIDFKLVDKARSKIDILKDRKEKIYHENDSINLF